MGVIDSQTVRVLHGLERCGMDPETRDDCGDCPYRDGESCIARLARDSRSLILQMDQFISVIERTKPKKPIDMDSKPIRGMRWCTTHDVCDTDDAECPYHSDDGHGCIRQLHLDLLRLLEGGGAP